MASRARRRLLLSEGERLLCPGEKGHGARVQSEDGDRDSNGRGQRKGGTTNRKGQGCCRNEREAAHDRSKESRHTRRCEETNDTEDRKRLLKLHTTVLLFFIRVSTSEISKSAIKSEQIDLWRESALGKVL